MSVENFLNQLMAGQSAEAAESISDILAAKAFVALDAKKQELAKTVFNNNSSEEQDTKQDTEE